MDSNLGDMKKGDDDIPAEVQEKLLTDYQKELELKKTDNNLKEELETKMNLNSRSSPGSSQEKGTTFKYTVAYMLYNYFKTFFVF